MSGKAVLGLTVHVWQGCSRSDSSCLAVRVWQFVSGKAVLGLTVRVWQGCSRSDSSCLARLF